MNVHFQLRGPEGVRSRIAELQSRLSKAFPSDTPPIQNNNQAQSGSPTSPFNPFSGSIGVTPMETPTQLKGMIQDAAKEAGIDPALFDALVANESSYDPNARSAAGAMGLTQLMPMTAKSLGVQNAFDPAQNLSGGARYLSQMLERFGGDVPLALAAYNAGPGAVEKYNGIPPYGETQNYVKRIMELMQRRGGQ